MFRIVVIDDFSFCLTGVVFSFFLFHDHLFFIFYISKLSWSVIETQNQKTIHTSTDLQELLWIFWGVNIIILFIVCETDVELNTIGTFSNEDGNASNDASEKLHFRFTFYFFMPFINFFFSALNFVSR